MILRIDHVSIAVKDFRKAEKFFSGLLGLTSGASGSDRSSGFFFRIYSAGDLSRFEIIAPERNGSFLDNFLNTRNGGVHHITFQVDDIRKTREELESMGIPYFGFNDKYDNWKELFIHPKDAFGVLIQMAEFSPSEWIDESMNIDKGRKWTVKKSTFSTSISIAHPGGGKIELELTVDEVEELIRDLKR